MHGPMNVKFVKERVELYLYSTLWTFVACYRVNFTFTFTFTFTLFIPGVFQRWPQKLKKRPSQLRRDILSALRS